MRLVVGARLAWHVVIAVAKLGLMARGWNASRRRAELSVWAQRIFALLRIRLVVRGIPPAGSAGCLLAGNHVSWLDIFALMAQVDARFVAKAEVRGWPIAGWLAAQVGTHFITRGSRTEAHAGAAALANFLETGHTVCIFPEGSTSDGTTLHPFRAALFEPAAQGGAPVQPFAIRYSDANGAASSIAAFVGEMTLIDSLLALLRHPGLSCEVTFLAPIDTNEQSRRELAFAVERAVKAELGVAVVMSAARQAAPVDAPTVELAVV